MTSPTVPLSPAPQQGSQFIEELLRKRVVLITGKGGVGRSCITAAVARVGERAGLRVLVADIGAEGEDYSPLAKLFERGRFASHPEPLTETMRGVTLLARAGQELFLASVLRTATIARAAMGSDAIRKLLSAGPSFREMGVYFQLLTYLRAAREDGSPEYELIVVDMPATGHTLSLTGLPDLLLGLVSTGPVADALREGQRYLNDPKTAAAYVVTLPETLPVSESLELLDGLAATAMPAGGVIVNRVPSDLFEAGERLALEDVVARHRLFGAEGFFRAETCRREIARLTARTSLPIFRIAEYPGTDSPVNDIADELDGHRRGAPPDERARVLRHLEHAHAHPPAPSAHYHDTIPPRPDDISVRSLLEHKRILVCCGAGGVGKTTMAAALSLAAARMGRRVLVLTIDPSRRLAETLGVTRNPPEPVPLPPDRRDAAGITTGSLEAWMLDPKLVADESVRRLTRSPEEAERVLQNRIYRQVSAMVAGMHEYTAMEALHRLVNSGKYDLVVLDTPPSRNALDFLDAPRRLSSLIDGRVFRAFLPGGGIVARTASMVAHRVLSAVFGAQFAGEFAIFMGTFSSIFAALNTDVTLMREFLSQPDAAFLLVTSPAPETLTEAHFFHDKTQELGLPFRGFVLNKSRARTGGRIFPGEGLVAEAPHQADARAGLTKLQYLARIEQAAAQGDRDLLAELRMRAGGEALAVAIPSLSEGADDMETLLSVADTLAAS